MSWVALPAFKSFASSGIVSASISSGPVFLTAMALSQAHQAEPHRPSLVPSNGFMNSIDFRLHIRLGRVGRLTSSPKMRHSVYQLRK
jgi:hypothetical protein